MSDIEITEQSITVSSGAKSADYGNSRSLMVSETTRLSGGTYEGEDLAQFMNEKLDAQAELLASRLGLAVEDIDGHATVEIPSGSSGAAQVAEASAPRASVPIPAVPVGGGSPATPKVSAGDKKSGFFKHPKKDDNPDVDGDGEAYIKKVAFDVLVADIAAAGFDSVGNTRLFSRTNSENPKAPAFKFAFLNSGGYKGVGTWLPEDLDHDAFEAGELEPTEKQTEALATLVDFYGLQGCLNALKG